MHRTISLVSLCLLLHLLFADQSIGQVNEKQVHAQYREIALKSGDATRGKRVFESKEAACAKCHLLKNDQPRTGPDLSVIGDKYSREQLIRTVLEPSATIPLAVLLLPVVLLKSVRDPLAVLLEPVVLRKSA